MNGGPLTVEIAGAAPLTVEIAYAAPQRAVVKTLHLPAGSVVADALRSAALDPEFAGVDLNSAVGIFGILASSEQRLEQGDRIEIYRPLARDPKTARRERAASAPRRAVRPVSKSVRS